MEIYGRRGLSEELRKKIDLFLADLNELMENGKTEGDFSELYAHHPDVRIGIRRAMLYLQKQKQKAKLNEHHLQSRSTPDC
jgi:hypothetical protein